jgi:hypothetical protein
MGEITLIDCITSEQAVKEVERNLAEKIPEKVPDLKLTDDVERLADEIIISRKIPAEYLEDAPHIALATVNGMDFLLIWNFNHINNAIIKREIIKVAEKNNYECPVICSLEELGGEPL